MADTLIERLPAGAAASELQLGAREGLTLQRGTVAMVQAQLDALGPDIDVKLLRAGNEAARDLTKLAVHVAEAEFRGRRDDELTELIALLAREKAKG